MEFFTLLKASQKSGKPNGVFWFSAKTEARAKLQVQVIIEDAGIETGRGCDYQLPIFTNFPVFDDLPEEEVIDFTWCDRYGLDEDGRTWQKIVVSAPVKAEPEVKEEITTSTNGQISPKVEEAMQWPVAQMSQRSLIISQFISEESTHHATPEQRKKIADLEMDTDNSYVQNMLWAADKATGFKSLSTHDVWKYTQAIKTVFAQDKRHELNAVITFAQAWVETPHIDRGLLVKEWANGKRITSIQRTDTGTNAGGGNVTDRSADYEHTLDTLDIEIAAATLPMDFDIYNIPGGIYRRAKEIISGKESPWKEWSAVLRKTPGILDYSRAAIFAVIRSAHPEFYKSPGRLVGYTNAYLTETDHAKPTAEILSAARQLDSAAVVAGVIQGTEPVESLDKLSTEFSVVGKLAAAAANPVDAKPAQPEVANLGGGMFSIDGLMGQQTNTSTTKEAADDVQMETTVTVESKTDSEVSTSQSTDDTGAPAVTMTNAEILAAAAPELAEAFSKEPESDSDEWEIIGAPVPEYPAYFEPGRYEGLPNNVYHAANGISSTQVKDARVSLMYFNARHVAKTIAREQSKVLDMGNLVHALALQPDNLEAEFSIEPVIPEGAFTTTATLRAFIDEYNAALPAQLSADDIKALLEAHNATLPAQVSLGGDKDAIGIAYLELPDEFKRIVGDDKSFTAAAMKACIKEYNATLPAQVKTSGSRDALLEQLSIINPDLVAQEAQKPAPLKVSGTKAEMIQVVKSVKPDAVFADELLDAWRANPDDKILVTRAQLATALAIQSALLAHPTAGKFLTHPSRAVEVSYFGFDDETGLEIRVRPDLEIDMNGVRIGFDLKTISMFNVKQPGLKAKLHREIIDRDYHLSAAMYMNTASLDQFFWIFVNKDEGYHWIAIVEASPELLELGALEYQTTMRAIANAFDTGEWPAPIVDDYADELNDFDMRRLEALREQA